MFPFLGATQITFTINTMGIGLPAHANSHATSCTSARAKSQNKQKIGQMAIARALPGFNDLGCTVTPTFLLIDHFLY